jgi:hypothetical protein
MSSRSKKPVLLFAAAIVLAGITIYLLVQRTSRQGQHSSSPKSTSMPTNPTLAKQREVAALAAIRKAFGTPDDEHGATLFVSHHLSEVDANYWRKHLGTDKPEPVRVLDILVFRDSWGGDDELQTFDFTLPDEVTNYVISVRFSDAGDIEEISMES